MSCGFCIEQSFLSSFSSLFVNGKLSINLNFNKLHLTSHERWRAKKIIRVPNCNQTNEFPHGLTTDQLQQDSEELDQFSMLIGGIRAVSPGGGGGEALKGSLSWGVPPRPSNPDPV